MTRLDHRGLDGRLTSCADVDLEHRAAWIRLRALHVLKAPAVDELWMQLLLEAAAFAAMPAIVGGRRCGAHVAGRFILGEWPGVFHGVSSACHACHGSGELGWVDHRLGCWMAGDGGEDPALVGACACGALVTAPRWASMSPTGVGCLVCGEAVELGFASPADRWAEMVRLGGPPKSADVHDLRPLVERLIQLRATAGPWATSAHAAALTRARLRQVPR